MSTSVSAPAHKFLKSKLSGSNEMSLDDTWSNITGRDPTTQRIKPDSNKFPSGIAALATKIHALGLKFGVYGYGRILCYAT